MSSRNASQVWNSSPSSEHSNSRPSSPANDSASSLERPKMTSGPVTSGRGVMNVSGGSKSSGGMMSHSSHSGVESTTPDGLTERTWKMCGPISSPSYTRGEVHGVKSAPSSE